MLLLFDNWIVKSLLLWQLSLVCYFSIKYYSYFLIAVTLLTKLWALNWCFILRDLIHRYVINHYIHCIQTCLNECAMSMVALFFVFCCEIHEKIITFSTEHKAIWIEWICMFYMNVLHITYMYYILHVLHSDYIVIT